MNIEEINEVCLKYNIENYTINEDLSIDVDGHVELASPNINLMVLPLKFNKVSGNFNCSYNNLKSLEGVPSYVGGHFDCSWNYLESLEGAPISVVRIFSCIGNKLTSLEGGPSSVYGKFYCYSNPLKSLKGIPLKLSKKQLYLPEHFTYSDYLEYCKVVERDLKFKKILK